MLVQITFLMHIVANWKMNGDLRLVEAYKKHLSKYKNIIVCPPYPFIENFVNSMAVGAQDLSAHKNGAFTGEISAGILKDIGCQYVIIGHSERKKYHCEDINIIKEKIDRALEANLKPIVCIDENFGDETLPYEKIWLAYEPTWAIGTGVTPTSDEVGSVIESLRKKTKCEKIFYGGSVNKQNIKDFIEKCDGFLVGGASLKIEEMGSMAHLCGM